MPNRILREGILSSEKMVQLSWGAEVFYRRLMSVADDFGRFHANEKLLRAALYPLQIDKVSDADIGKWIAEVREAALVSVYPAKDGKRYLEIASFGQQTRSKSKYPPPDDSSCEQMLADASKCSLYSESESDSYSETKSDSDARVSDARGEMAKAVTLPDKSVVMALAPTIGVEGHVADAWWEETNSRPLAPDGSWTDRNGRPIRVWQSALKAYAVKWAANDARRALATRTHAARENAAGGQPGRKLGKFESMLEEATKR